jgi:DNA transformation protein
MATDPSFVEHALELVALVAPVDARRMFGGHGLYAHGVMFGLLDDGELFLKTDEESRPRFVAAGCRRWTYVSKKVRMEETSYFRPPDEAHEDPEAMLPWARLALDAALRVRAARLAGTTRKAAPRSGGRAAAAKRQPRSPRKEVAPRKRAAAPRKASSGEQAPAGPARRVNATPPARAPKRAGNPARRGKR